MVKVWTKELVKFIYLQKINRSLGLLVKKIRHENIDSTDQDQINTFVRLRT